ncbi:MAG: arginine--tRNA ligase [Candidatus Portnoybacteria bacterium]
MRYDKKMLREEVKKAIEDVSGKEAGLEHPANSEHGDFSTNVALREKISPDEIIAKLKGNPLFAKVDKAGPGFINLTLSKKALSEELSEIIEKEDNYGNLNIGGNKKIQVEFISANPTGPLTVGNARGGPYGDTLANVLKKAGFKVEKAYYINDAGMQILTLGHSILKDKKGKYQGEYIDKLNKEIKETDPFKAGQLAAKHIIKEYIQKTTDKLGIKYDEWIFESDLYSSGKVDQALKLLEEKGLIFEEDGAQWFKSSKFGDERDRVIIKNDGEKTYLAGDIALHRYKFEDKKFDRVINIWGADHHGDVLGLMAGVEAIGHKGKLETILLQFVTLLDKGKKKKMSKRAGIYVDMDEILDQVGSDAVRFFVLQKSNDTHLNFDLELAKEQSNKNPVFYIQYAHARICSILKKAGDLEAKLPSTWELSFQVEELNLVRQLIRFPEIIEDTSKDYQVQRLPQYSLELANAFHRFYENCRVIGKDEEENQSRLSLVKATQIVLKNSLSLMGINAPEKM